MKSLITFLFVLLGFYPNLYSQVQIGDDINGTTEDEYLGFRVGLSENGKILAMLGRSPDDFNKLYIYQDINENWSPYGLDVDGGHFENLRVGGIGLSDDGSTLAYSLDKSLQVLTYSDGVWIEKGGLIENLKSTNAYNIKISYDGNIIILGDQTTTEIYNFEGEEWVNIGSFNFGLRFEALDISANGKSISMANLTETRVFELTGETWSLKGDVIPGFAEIWGGVDAVIAGSYKETSLSSDGSIVAISEGFLDNSIPKDRTRLYKYELGSWHQLGRDLIHGDIEVLLNGPAVSLSGDGRLVAIGLPAIEPPYQNKVVLYEWVNNQWEERIDITGDASNYRGYLSIKLSLNANRIAIGDPTNDAITENSGQVRVFELNSLLSTYSFNLSEIRLYPNPAAQFINVIIPNSTVLNEVNIFNSFGQLVMRSRLEKVNVSSLSPGIYIGEIITNRGRAYKNLIIH